MQEQEERAAEEANRRRWERNYTSEDAQRELMLKAQQLKQQSQSQHAEKEEDKSASDVAALLQELNVFYCKFCGGFALILGMSCIIDCCILHPPPSSSPSISPSSSSFIADTTLDQLPKRKTDGSLVLETSKHKYKNKMVKGEVKLVKRTQGLERQYRYNCPQCGLFLAYASTPHDSPMERLYLLSDGLTENPIVK